MKFLMAALGIFMLTLQSQAQNLLWQKQLKFGSRVNTMVAAEPAGGGDVIIAARLDTLAYSVQWIPEEPTLLDWYFPLCVFRMSESGEIKWFTKVGAIDRPDNARFTTGKDGALYIYAELSDTLLPTNYGPHVIKLDTNGTVRWMRPLPNRMEAILTMAPAWPNGIYIGANRYQPLTTPQAYTYVGHVARFDSSGSLMWNKDFAPSLMGWYEWGYYGTFTESMADGSAVLTGIKPRQDATDFTVNRLRINAAAQPVDSMSFPLSALNGAKFRAGVQTLQDSSILLYYGSTDFSGPNKRTAIQRYSKQGQLLWQQSWPVESGWPPLITADTGMVQLIEPTRVMRLRSNGSTAWTYDFRPGVRLWHQVFTREQKVLVAGNKDSVNNTWLYVAKVNGGSTNHLPPNFLTRSKPLVSERVQVYPNPATGLVRFELPAGIYEASISTAAGQQVMQTRLEDGQMDVSSLAAGVYVVQLRGARGIYHSRLIRQ